MARISTLALVCGMGLAAPALASDDVDSAARAGLLNASAMYDSFEIDGGNGASLQITGYLLTRYLVGHSDGFGAEDTYVGFDQPRLRIGVKGKLDETFGYKFIMDLAGGGTVATDALVTAKVGDRSVLTFGQFTQPFTREQDVSSSRQLAVERSVANSFFTVDRSQGVMLEWKGENLRWRGALSDGAKNTGQEWTDDSEADFALTGRVEYLTEGAWGQFKDFQGWRSGQRGLMLGGAVHYETTGDTGGGTGASTTRDDRLAFTLDASAEFSGGSVMGGFYSMSRETASGDFTDLGCVLQGSVMAGEQSELFARWDTIFADSDRVASDDLHVVTAGFNYFFVPESHAAKLTVDVQHVFGDLNDTPVSSSSKRTIIDSDDAQTALRAQFVLGF